MEDIFDGLGLKRMPLVGLSYGAGVAIRPMSHAPERASRVALVSPAGVVTGPIPRILARVALPMLLYRLRATRERLLRAARPILTEPEAPAFGPAVRQLVARSTDTSSWTPVCPGRPPEELEGFGGPVAVSASGEDVFFPGEAVLARAKEIVPNLALAECLKGCRHVPSEAAFECVNEGIRAFLAGYVGA